MKTIISFHIVIYIDDHPGLKMSIKRPLEDILPFNQRISEALRTIAPPTLAVTASAIVDELSRVTKGKASASLDDEQSLVQSPDGWGSNYLEREWNVLD